MADTADFGSIVPHWEVEVNEKQDRIRIPKDVRGCIPWLKDLPRTVYGIPGKKNQLILTPDVWHGKLWATLKAELRRSPPSINDLENPIVTAGRYFGFVWEVTCRDDTDRVAITIPRGARFMSFGPPMGGAAVAFAIGGLILEVWDLALWKTEFLSLRDNEANVKNQVEDYLTDQTRETP
jgi:hypothetical protein